MFDCYSLAIEAYLHAADPNYFVIDHRDIEYGVSAKLLPASRSKGINIWTEPIKRGLWTHH